MEELDRLEDAACPVRWTRVAFKVAGSLVALALASIGAWTIVRMAGTAAGTVETGASRVEDGARATAGVDAAWFARTRVEIQAMDAEVASVQSALAMAREDAASRVISRQDDRDRVAQLSQRLLDLRSRRAALAKEHDLARASAPPGLAAGVVPLGPGGQ